MCLVSQKKTTKSKLLKIRYLYILNIECLIISFIYDKSAIFSTAQAINVLVSTWTSQDVSTKGLKWKSQTPESVIHLVKTSVEWLMLNVFNPKYKAFNAFFSGSVKGESSLPFWYPTNFVQFLNGTTVDPSKTPTSVLEYVINGVSGLIDEAQYQTLLKEPHFGQATPIDFPGYNTQANLFPFWCSEPYTYAVALLALSQFHNIQ
jgi:hypothetical protein